MIEGFSNRMWRHSVNGSCSFSTTWTQIFTVFFTGNICIHCSHKKCIIVLRYLHLDPGSLAKCKELLKWDHGKAYFRTKKNGKSNFITTHLNQGMKNFEHSFCFHLHYFKMFGKKYLLWLHSKFIWIQTAPEKTSTFFKLVLYYFYEHGNVFAAKLSVILQHQDTNTRGDAWSGLSWPHWKRRRNLKILMGDIESASPNENNLWNRQVL